MRPSHLIQLRLSVMAAALLLAGCEVPGMGPDPKIALRQADGKAIGAACRHALRGIEDCYGLNEKALKTSVFEGWKEMDQYMRDNKIEGVAPKAAKVDAAEDTALVVDKSPKHDAKEKVASDAHSKADTGKNKAGVKLAQTSEGH
jgi:hypothetical protein